ncbi:MAG: chondroitinase-B domain-containing protein [Pseudomonadota bacterium]
MAQANNPCPPPAFGVDGGNSSDNETDCGAVLIAPSNGDDEYGIQSENYTRIPASFSSSERVTNVSQLSAALSRARPGGVVWVADGTYNLTSHNEEWFYWNSSNSGTASNKVYLLAENKGRVTFQGGGRIALRANHIVVAGIAFNIETRLFGDNIRFAHNKVFGATPRRFHVGIYGDDAEIDNTEFTQITGHAMWMAQGHSNGPGTIKRPHVHHNEWRDIPVPSRGESTNIMLGYSLAPLPAGYDDNVEALIENNIFERAQGDWEVISVKSSRNVIRNNCFIANGKSFIEIRMGNENIVTGNKFGNIDNSGFHISGHRNVFAFNYFARDTPGQYAMELHSRGQYAAPAEVPSWAVWRFNSADDNVISSNVFENFASIFRIYSPSATFLDSPSGNFIQSNDFKLSALNYYQDSSARLSYSQFQATNNFANNSIRTANSARMGSCASVPSHQAGSSPVSVNGNYNGIAGGKINPPSWW